jgi:hypothetical protein
MKTKVFVYSLLLSFLTIFLFPKNIEGNKVVGYPISFITFYDIEHWYSGPLSILNPLNINFFFSSAAFLANTLFYFFIILLGIWFYKKLTLRFFK